LWGPDLLMPCFLILFSKSFIFIKVSIGEEILKFRELFLVFKVEY